MAQAQFNNSIPNISSKDSKTDTDEQSQNAAVLCVPECAVCLQTCIHPARLPCNHVFCYLCIKGVANQSKRCPMCRQEIPTDFIEKPELLEIDHSYDKQTASTDDSSPEEFQWFYEGRNGWWQYDQRTNLELETAYKEGKSPCELLIAGFLYVVDFNTMIQSRRNDHSRKRRIKRDRYNAPKKGIAGIRLNTCGSQELTQQDDHSTEQATERTSTPNNNEAGHITNVSASTSNTSHSPDGSAITEDTVSTSGVGNDQPDSLHHVLEQIRSIFLSDDSFSNNQR